MGGPPRSKWLWWVVLVLVFLLEGLACEGCWEEEKVALLQLKPFFDKQQDEDGWRWREALENWVESEENSDCCEWVSVECDATTGRVIGLSLSERLSGSYYPDPFFLNASLFLPFEGLRTLSLSAKGIAGCLHDHGFENLAWKLNKLEVLDLSYNYFNDTNILSSFVEFSSLKSLNLSHNRLTAPIHTNGFIGPSTKWSSIETLDLSENYNLDDGIFLALSELPSLKYLDLSFNQISGSSHININGFKSLETLYLSGNQKLGNNILSRLGNLSSLKTLHLEDCGVNGTIQIQEMKDLINLKELYLSDNPIQSLGSFQDKEDDRQSGLINLELLALTLNFSSLGPFSKGLKHLYIWYRGTQGSIDIEDARTLKYVKSDYFAAVPVVNYSVLLPQSLDLFPSLKTLQFGSDEVLINFRELSHLTNLEELFVERTFIPTNFFEDIGKLTSLRVLSLYDCSRNGSLSVQGLLHLKNLESLKIRDDGNFIREDNFVEISLESNFLEKIGAMTSLKILSLPSCELSGTLPAQGICELTSMEELDISLNNLTGTLPDCFSNLTSLRHLNLSSNQFSGNLSSLVGLTSMESIDLSNNQFQIPSSLKPFFNHSKLKHLNGDNNHIFAETELFAPRFQLNFISLSCCGNGGTLPKFLHHQYELQYVGLSNINLTGEFPSWLLENNTQLDSLFLLNNRLSGHLKLPFHSPMILSKLDISSNFFDGHIPIEIGKCLPGLTFLNISKNSLDGAIPSSIGGMKLLEILDLSNNRLSGIIPDSLGVNCSSLTALILSNNRLQGHMFSSNFNLTNLEMLQLAGNNFTGVIPDSLTNCSALSIIDVSDNHISGKIPRSMGNLSALMVLFMVNNHIEGHIPVEFCQISPKVLDLSMNNISGIPPCFSPYWINHVHLSKNRLRGPIPHSLCNSPFLVTLDLSYNQLSGNIPNCIGNLSELSYLVLKHNNLEGEIPNMFCRLDKLSLIDLSQNNLSGAIPPCLNVTAYEEVAGDTYDSSRPYHHGIRGYPTETFSTDGSIELTTKSMSYSYKGRILRYLSGIDFSCNKLIGEIPHQMGNFHMIHVLNLSHNGLRGLIPPSLSNLTQIESLDLSYNNLSGGIPPQLVQLYSLAYFNVSYNNLSGKPPPRAGQFASNIDENSYWGNPFFCGECLLPNKSSTIKPSSNSTQHHEEDVGGLIDVESFWVTFGGSYIMVVLGIAAVLYINPNWRGAWFYLVERVIATCFYFVIDNVLPRRFRFCYI